MVVEARPSQILAMVDHRYWNLACARSQMTDVSRREQVHCAEGFVQVPCCPGFAGTKESLDKLAKQYFNVISDRRYEAVRWASTAVPVTSLGKSHNSQQNPSGVHARKMA